MLLDLINAALVGVGAVTLLTLGAGYYVVQNDSYRPVFRADSDEMKALLKVRSFRSFVAPLTYLHCAQPLTIVPSLAQG